MGSTEILQDIFDSFDPDKFSRLFVRRTAKK
jgi:hypothetical protein